MSALLSSCMTLPVWQALLLSTVGLRKWETMGFQTQHRECWLATNATRWPPKDLIFQGITSVLGRPGGDDQHGPALGRRPGNASLWDERQGWLSRRPCWRNLSHPGSQAERGSDHDWTSFRSLQPRQSTCKYCVSIFCNWYSLFGFQFCISQFLRLINGCQVRVLYTSSLAAPPEDEPGGCCFWRSSLKLK